MRLSLLRARPANLLDLYLNDHLAGAAAGLELLRRCRARNRGTPVGDELGRLEPEIERDRRALLEVMGRLGVPPDRLRERAAVAMERVGRLSMNGQVAGYSDLSRVVELEGLSDAVDAKRKLWLALERLAPRDARLGGTDHGALARRAEEQRERLERLRLDAVERAFGGALSGG